MAGLGTALCASRSGHEVTLVERDDTPLPQDPHGAFEWDRRGAPQVRHSHAFLARLRNLLRDRHPDVLAALFAAGATEMDFIDMLPEGMDRTRLPGDEDLVAIACRRTTFEWVLRRTVLADDAVTLRHGTAVTGVRVTDGDGPVPRVDGVVLDDAGGTDGGGTDGGVKAAGPTGPPCWTRTWSWWPVGDGPTCRGCWHRTASTCRSGWRTPASSTCPASSP